MGDANVFNVIVYKGFILSIGYAFGTAHLALGFIAFEWNVSQRKTKFNQWIGFAVQN